MELLLVIVAISLSGAFYDWVNKRKEEDEKKQEDNDTVNKVKTNCTMEPLNLKDFEFDDEL